MAVRITDLFIGKISQGDKMRIQIFQEIAVGYRKIDTDFPEKGWKLARLNKSAYHFSLAS